MADQRIADAEPAQYFFEIGYFAAYADAIVRYDVAPYALTDSVIDKAWQGARKGAADPAEFDRMRAKTLQPLTPEMRRLVIAARRVAYEVEPGEAPDAQLLTELDRAVEGFAADVPWDGDASPPTIIALDAGSAEDTAIVALLDYLGAVQDFRVLPRGASNADIARAAADLRARLNNGGGQ